MKKFNSILFIFIALILLSGCSSKEEKKEKQLLNNPSIESFLTNQIISMNNLPKTLELMSKGEGYASDYTKDDMLLYGIERRISEGLVPTLSDEEKQALNLKGITNVASYIDISDIKGYAKDNFGNISLDYKTITGCPTFIYDEANKKYYIQDECTSTLTNYIIYYIDEFTTIDNEYYVTVYAGMIENNVVYSDFNKKKVVTELNGVDSYYIKDDNKGEFSKVVYTFKKNSSNKYIFKNFKIK